MTACKVPQMRRCLGSAARLLAADGGLYVVGETRTAMLDRDVSR